MANDSEWLANLKPGDEVFIPSSFGVGTIVKVTKRMPSGRIVAGCWTFKQNGSRVGGDRWDSARLKPVTQEVRDALEHQSLVGEIQSAASREKLKAMPLEKLRAIVAMFR